MSKQISLMLPDEVMRRAEALAGRSGREVADVLADAIEVSLGPLGLTDDLAAPPASSAGGTDEQVLADADATMPAAEDRRLSELLARQQAGWRGRRKRSWPP